MSKPEKQPVAPWLQLLSVVVGTLSALVVAVWATPAGGYIDEIASGPAQLRRLNDDLTAQAKREEQVLAEAQRTAAAVDAVAADLTDLKSRMTRIERMLNVALAARTMSPIAPIEPPAEKAVAPEFSVRMGFGPVTPTQ